MILADKIMEERKKNGWSQEELADKLSVSRQSVSKWESAQSTPDLQRVIRMAELFGVSIDYLLRDEMEAEREPVAPMIPESTGRILTMEETVEFLEMKLESAGRVAGAVSLCILSPALLIFLLGLSEGKVMKEGTAVGIGMVFLLGLIALAVYTFISYSIKNKRFEYIEHEDFETAYGVTGLVREKKKDFEKIYARGIGLGVVLCILAVLPMIVAAVMEASDMVVISLTSVLLVLVALGVNRIVRVCIIQEGFEQILQEGEYTGAEKRWKKKMDLYQTIYWCTVTAGYLAWSFASNRWEFTWIVWPVAAVFNAAATAIVRIVSKEQ